MEPTLKFIFHNSGGLTSQESVQDVPIVDSYVNRKKTVFVENIQLKGKVKIQDLKRFPSENRG